MSTSASITMFKLRKNYPEKTFQVVSYEEAGAPSDMWSVGVIYHAMPI